MKSANWPTAHFRCALALCDDFTVGQRITQLLRAKVSDFDADTNTLRLWDIKGKRADPREHLIPLGPQAASIVKVIYRNIHTE